MMWYICKMTDQGFEVLAARAESHTAVDSPAGQRRIAEVIKEHGEVVVLTKIPIKVSVDVRF